MKKIICLVISVLSFILCGIVYISSHSEQVCIAKADYYFKRNDIKSAIKYYEDGFELGSKDTKARYNYVNMVINSPLDADAQERLVKFIKYPQQDGAWYKANSFLSELRVEIHRKYPDNYISQATYNQKILRWSENPITYGYTSTEDVPEYFIEEFNNAFSAWERNLDKTIKFKFVETNPQIEISFNKEEPDAEEAEKYIAALTKPVINSNILKKMTINCYLKSPDGEYFTENQIYNTALHEIGHAIGFMGHSDHKKHVMHMATDTTTVSNDLRKNLTNADINTIKLLYAIKPDISDKKTVSGEYTKYLVIGNDTDVANAKLREAKIYIQKVPNLPSGYIDLADSYLAMGEYTKAIKSLNKALTLAKDEDTVCMIYYNLALTNYLKGDYERAKVYLAKSGELKKTEDSVRLLAEIYNNSGGKSEAISIYEELISKNPSNIEYVIALTNIYVRDKEYLKARKVLKSFVSKNPAERNNPRLAPYGVIRLFL